jgi:hypothetical protein
MSLVSDAKDLVVAVEKAAAEVAGGAVDVAKTAVDEAVDLAKKILGTVAGGEE